MKGECFVDVLLKRKQKSKKMGASGKWVKALVGFKKSEKEDHVSSKKKSLVFLVYHFVLNMFCCCLGEEGKEMEAIWREGFEAEKWWWVRRV